MCNSLYNFLAHAFLLLPEIDSCTMAGFRSCCTNTVCQSPSSCFCDSDCYRYGDCCEDIEESCTAQNESIFHVCYTIECICSIYIKPMLILYSYSGGAYLLVSNILYIHRISMDGSRIKTIYSANSVGRIIAIDYDYR